MTPFQTGRNESVYKIVKNLIDDYDKKFSKLKKIHLIIGLVML